MKTAAQLREEASVNGIDFWRDFTEKIRKYIDTRIEEEAKRGFYSTTIHDISLSNLNDDLHIVKRSEIINYLISHYRSLGYTFNIWENKVRSPYYIHATISWDNPKPSLWQKIKNIWSKK